MPGVITRRAAPFLLAITALALAAPRAGPAALPPRAVETCFSNFSAAPDTTKMQPKDFCLVDGGDAWHLFYTRQYTTPNYANDRDNTHSIGHAVSTDRHLSSWTIVDRAAIHTRPGRIWDNLHVWAPCVVRQDSTWYMFYTGVQYDTVTVLPQLVTTEIQRIGIATSTDLTHWTQDLEPVFFAKKVPWTYQDSTALGNGGVGWQFRDPYVMPHPSDPGEWLMAYVVMDSTSNQFVVGLATTVGGDLRVWRDVEPLLRTSQKFMHADRVESPQIFRHNGNWWLTTMSNHFQANDQITYALNAVDPTDSAAWSPPDTLKAITCGEHDYPSFLNQLHALEHVAAGPNEILGGFSNTPLSIGIIQFTRIQPPDATCPDDSLRLDCPEVWTAVDPPDLDGAFSLALEGPRPARERATLRLALPKDQRVHVAIYDVFGRRVRTLADEWLPAGVTRLEWDGRDGRGAGTPSGVYFARATGAGGRRVVRVPLTR